MIVRSGPVTLADGSEAERAAISYQDDDGAAAVRRVRVARRGGFTFVLVLSAPATEAERQRETFDTILASFTSFLPAPYGIPRDRAFTMPLGEPSTLDPAIAREVTSHLFVTSVFSGLVRFGDDLSVEPDLAEDWEIDEAGVVYTFTLRDGITFHDGRPITADDFKYSIERAADPEVHSDTAALYVSDIVGVRERLDGDATEVSGVEAVDERTVRITIDAPKEYFLAKLAYPFSAVVDRLTVEPLGADWWMSNDVNGFGPFRLLRWDEEVVILQRFDEYHTPVSLEYLISPLVALRGAARWTCTRRTPGMGCPSAPGLSIVSGKTRRSAGSCASTSNSRATSWRWTGRALRSTTQRCGALSLWRSTGNGSSRRSTTATWNSRTGCCRPASPATRNRFEGSRSTRRRRGYCSPSPGMRTVSRR